MQPTQAYVACPYIAPSDTVAVACSQVETEFIENQIGSGQIRWEAILDK